MKYSVLSLAVFAPLTLGSLADAQGTLISIDFQPDFPSVNFSGNETVAAGIEPCFDGAGTWNHIAVPYNTSPAQVNANVPLVDSTGTSTDARLILTGSLTGYLENLGTNDDLRDDYLFFNAFANPTTSIDWSLTGLSAGTAHEIVIYGHAAFDRSFLVTVDTDGDGDLADETPIATSPQTTVLPPIRSSADGRILARCEGIGEPGFANEASWAGFQVVAANDVQLIDNYASVQPFNDGKYTFIDLFGGSATLQGLVGPDLQLDPGVGQSMAVLWNDGEVLSQPGDRVSLEVSVTGPGGGGGVFFPGQGAGLYLAGDLALDDLALYTLHKAGLDYFLVSPNLGAFPLSGPPSGPSLLTIELIDILGPGLFELRIRLEGNGFDTIDLPNTVFSNFPSSFLHFGPAVSNAGPGEHSMDNLTFYRGGLEATYGETNGTGLNQNLQAAVPAVLGQPWSSTVIIGDPSAPFTGFLLLFFNPNVLTTGITLSLGGPMTELLIGPSPLALPCGVEPYAGPFATSCPAVVIPNDCSLVGMPWATQIAVGSPSTGYTLTNASFGVVGTR